MRLSKRLFFCFLGVLAVCFLALEMASAACFAVGTSVPSKSICGYNANKGVYSCYVNRWTKIADVSGKYVWDGKIYCPVTSGISKFFPDQNCVYVNLKRVCGVLEGTSKKDNCDQNWTCTSNGWTLFGGNPPYVGGNTFFGNSLDEGLVSYWRLDEDRVYEFDSGFYQFVIGYTPNEFGSNARLGDHPIAQSDDPQLIESQYNYAFDFNSENKQYIYAGPKYSYSSPSFSISAWVSPRHQPVDPQNPPYPNQGVVAGAFSFSPSGGDSDDCAHGYYLSSLNPPGNFRLRIDPNGCGDNEVGLDFSSSTVKDWYHVIVTYDGPTKTGKAYIDGSLISSKTFSDTFGLDSVQSFVIGGEIYSSSLNSYIYHYNGSIDEVSYWNRSLSLSEAQQLYEHYRESMGVISQTGWKDLRGQQINSTNFGDTVKMEVTGENFDVSSPINFTIWKNSTWFWFWKISTQISPSLMSSTWVTDEARQSVFFKALQENTEVISDGLDILNFVSNSLPNALISSPEKEEIFFSVPLGQEISFTQESYDEDDLLELIWNFGDGTNHTVYDYSYLNSSQGNKEYMYTQGGKYYDVVLTAKEMTRDQSAQDSVRIYVFQPGINVVPIISSPAYGSVQSKHQVVFNASQSYVANCSTNMNPSNFSVGNLNCSYILAPGQKDPLSGTVKVRWSVQKVGNSSWELITPTEGIIWNSTNYNAMGGVEFNRLFSELSQRKARLEVMYDE